MIIKNHNFFNKYFFQGNLHIKLTYTKINSTKIIKYFTNINRLKEINSKNKFSSSNNRNRFGFLKVFSKRINTESKDDGKQILNNEQIIQSIKITDNCINRIDEVIKEKNKFLRLMVDGGGCSGYQYIFKVDQKNIDDIIINDKIIIDEISLPFLEGATIDYKTSMIRNAFIVLENPKAELICSCGSSFTPKLKI